MDQNTLQALLKEAVREAVAEVLQTLMELDREAFLKENGGVTRSVAWGRTATTPGG